MNPSNSVGFDVVPLLTEAVERLGEWEAGFGAFDRHIAQSVDYDRLRKSLDAYTARLRGNYPFFHPRYAGQMLKPPHPVAILGYATAMIINPNNHALDGGPPTGRMEKEVVGEIASSIGFPADTLGHLTSSGTIANLEALWIARESAPGKQVAFSEDAHYTHARMAQVLGMDTVVIPSTPDGRMQTGALERELGKGRIGVVVMTAGSTGLGAIDDIEEGIRLREKYGFRLHVDAAYGGLFAILARAGSTDVPIQPLIAMEAADSVVIDPHKHGLQPYGCGCVLFRDPSVGTFYKHDSPYTYFTSDELHLGEISLECSRAGASAGALWLTLQCLPLEADRGLGPILAAGLRAARDWYDRLGHSDLLLPYTPPELDIVTFFPRTSSDTVSAVDEASRKLFARTMADEEHPVFLSVLKIPAEKLCSRHSRLQPDVVAAGILRSVLMKPEHESWTPYLHKHVEHHAEAVID